MFGPAMPAATGIGLILLGAVFDARVACFGGHAGFFGRKTETVDPDRSAILGSTSHKLLHLSERPVVVVRA